MRVDKMKTMVKHFIFLLSALLLSSLTVLNAQDAHFTQFYANSLYLNPAFAGAERCPKISLNYRNQWLLWVLPMLLTVLLMTNT